MRGREEGGTHKAYVDLFVKNNIKIEKRKEVPSGENL